MTRKVLVLGGAGYIGSHVAKALALRGDIPIVIDNLSSGHEAFVRWGPLLKADIREQALEDAARAGEINFAALRYFNAAGASPDGDLGEAHDPETHLIPLALQAADGTGAPLKLFGTDYDTADGSCVRDFIHVSDLARGHLRALDRLLGRDESFACNLGTGHGVSVLEVLKAVAEVVGRPVPHSVHARRAGDPAELYANTGYACHMLGFKTFRSSIKDIVTDAWNYHRMNAQAPAPMLAAR